MAESDALLLERFSHQADAQAFSELVHQYARLVYGTAFRILHNQSDAADISQETFIALHQQAGRISGSLTAWLHRVATNKAFDLLRRTRRRSHREEAYALSRSTEIQTWQALSGQVDKALEKLDRPLRAMLLDHFMAGKTETQIARDRGISQATVSRHINDGLSQLRGILKRQGALVAGAAALSTMLMESSVQAVPDAVMGELSKLAMVGTGSIAAGSAGIVAGLTKAWAVGHPNHSRPGGRGVDRRLRLPLSLPVEACRVPSIRSVSCHTIANVERRNDGRGSRRRTSPAGGRSAYAENHGQGGLQYPPRCGAQLFDLG